MRISRAHCRFIIALLVLCVGEFCVFPHDNRYVHPAITESAAKSSDGLEVFLSISLGAPIAPPFLNVKLGYPSGKPPQTALECLRLGSRHEDGEQFLETAFRTRNHFYDPTKVPGIGLTDGIDGWAASSLAWATVTSAAPLANTRIWGHTRACELASLTNNSPSQREAAMGEALYTLGFVLHLNQDLSVPAHVRNDNHAPLFGENFFEIYGKSKCKRASKAEIDSYFPLRPRGWTSWRNAGFRTLQSFWDKDIYSGSVAELRNALLADATSNPGVNQLGLAEFCNANLISEDAGYKEDTSPGKHFFPYPTHTGTTYNRVRQNLVSGIKQGSLRNGVLINQMFLEKTAADGIPVLHHSAMGYRVVSELTLGGPGTNRRMLVAPNIFSSPEVAEDYFTILIPKAIEYSAGILEYFFRGQITIDVVRRVGGRWIEFQVTNNSGERFYGGTFRLYADGVDGTRYQVSSLSVPWGEGEILEPGASRAFGFCEPCVPPGTDCDCPVPPAKYTLVYQGTIGTSGTGENIQALDPVDEDLAIAARSFAPPPPQDSIILPVYANVTTVPNFAVPPSPANIPPYARPNFENAYPSCATAPGCGAPGQPECGIPNLIPQNQYTLKSPAETVTISGSKAGFKNVFGIKSWHGIWGPMSPMWKSIDAMNPDGSCKTRGLQQDPDTQKYRTLSATASATLSGGVNGSAMVSSSCTVDQLSGRRTGTGQIMAQSGDETVVGDARRWLGYATTKLADLPDIYLNYTEGMLTSVSHQDDLVVSQYGTLVSVAMDYDDDWWAGHESYHALAQLDILSGWFHWEAGSRIEDDHGFIGTWTNTFDVVLGPTSVSVEWVKTVNDPHELYGPPEDNSWGSCTATFSNPYTSEMLNNDVDAALAVWNLADDIQYPWRQDGAVTNGPLVTYNEREPTAPEILPIGWVDTTLPPRSDIGEGMIVGAPLPRNVSQQNPHGVRYEPFFNFAHKNYQTCNSLYDGSIVWYVESFGAYAPSHLPYATQWINDRDAGAIPQGAFAAYNSLYYPDTLQPIAFAPNCLVKGKYAEVLLPRLAHNFARPGGRDRYVLDKPTVHCVESAAPALVTITEPETAIYTGDTGMVVGGGFEGLYPISRISDTQFGLGLKICNLPAIVSSESHFFGKLRWPSASAIRGQVPISLSVAEADGPIMVSVESPTLLRNGDAVVVSGSGFLPANGTWTITRLTENSFSLNGSSGIVGNGTGGSVRSITSPENRWQWDDNKSQGDWCLLNWGYNFRDVGERERLHTAYLSRLEENANRVAMNLPVCGNLSDPPVVRPNTGPLSSIEYDEHRHPFVSCCRPVVTISPNGEQHLPGTGVQMPSLVCDEEYGALWQSIPKQWMQDPLWQTPPRPCGMDESGLWQEDDGSGQADGWIVHPVTQQMVEVRYYPQRPWEECRASVPVGAPAIPPGGFLGALTVNEINQTPIPPGNVANPPLPGRSHFAPWTIFLKQQANIAAAGRFSCQYADPQADCGGDFVIDTP